MDKRCITNQKMRGLFSKKLNEFIIEAQMSRREFAEKIGISPDIVKNWLNGKSFPRSEEIREIAYILGCYIDELLCMDEYIKMRDEE